MNERDPRTYTKEDWVEIGRRLKDRRREADRIAAPLFARMVTEDALIANGTLDRENGDHLNWDKDGNTVIVRGTQNAATEETDDDLIVIHAPAKE